MGSKNASQCNIDLSNFGSRVYSGRQRGEKVKMSINLSELEKRCPIIKVTIPPDTYHISSSFFLALFENSIIAAGNKENFLNKFHFIGHKTIINRINRYFEYI